MKILVFAPNWLGDVIFITPAFKALKAAFPHTVIGCCLPRRCGDVLLNNPYVDELIFFNERKEDKGIGAKLRFVARLRKARYDKVFLLHRSATRAFLCWLGGVCERMGYGYQKRSWLMTKTIPVINKDSVHKQDYYLNILQGFGIEVKDSNCEIFLSGAEKEKAKAFLAPYCGKKLIALNLFTNWAPKNWPLEYFNEFIAIMRQHYPDTVFFLTSAQALDRVSFFSAAHGDAIVDLCGKTSVRELAAIYANMDLVVSGDSGPLHLAAAVGARYIGIYGPTSDRLTSVRASAQGVILACHGGCDVPCYKEPCLYGLKCIKGVAPQVAAQSAMELLR